MSNRLVDLMKTGQSIWFDNIKRSMLTDGELARYVSEDDLRGVTSNPSIFEKAINGSTDYDDQMRGLIEKGLETKDIYEALVIDDIRNAADVLRPVYDRTNRTDGYISLEVDPRLAYETEATIDEASRLFNTVDRPNVMIKIPAAQEGLPAIAESIHRGVNINVTMIFSIENYKQVADAFITGLERRAAEGKPVDGIASVASFFVSRVDTAVDKKLDELASADGSNRDELLALRGQAAVANAKLAYQTFKEIFHESGRFKALRDKGAQVQRCLWASTGTKNPDYSDILYVDTLIGPETVNTIPPHTYVAFKDHGTVELTLEQDLGEASALLSSLSKHGVDMDDVTTKLQKDGLDAFVHSFDTLLDTIVSKREALASGVQG